MRRTVPDPASGARSTEGSVPSIVPAHVALSVTALSGWHGCEVVTLCGIIGLVVIELLEWVIFDDHIVFEEILSFHLLLVVAAVRAPGALTRPTIGRSDGIIWTISAFPSRATVSSVESSWSSIGGCTVAWSDAGTRGRESRGAGWNVRANNLFSREASTYYFSFHMLGHTCKSHIFMYVSLIVYNTYLLKFNWNSMFRFVLSKDNSEFPLSFRRTISVSHRH